MQKISQYPWDYSRGRRVAEVNKPIEYILKKSVKICEICDPVFYFSTAKFYYEFVNPIQRAEEVVVRQAEADAY